MGFLLREAEPERRGGVARGVGTSGSQWTYSMALKPLDAAAPYDAVIRHRDLAIVVPECDFDKVRGATIDWLDDPFAAVACAWTTPTRRAGDRRATGRRPERRRSPAGDPAARPAGDPLDRRAQRPRRARGGRARNRLPQAGRRLSRLRDGHGRSARGSRRPSSRPCRSHDVVDVTDRKRHQPYFEAAKK